MTKAQFIKATVIALTIKHSEVYEPRTEETDAEAEDENDVADE